MRKVKKTANRRVVKEIGNGIGKNTAKRTEKKIGNGAKKRIKLKTKVAKRPVTDVESAVGVGNIVGTGVGIAVGGEEVVIGSEAGVGIEEAGVGKGIGEAGAGVGTEKGINGEAVVSITTGTGIGTDMIAAVVVGKGGRRNEGGTVRGAEAMIEVTARIARTIVNPAKKPAGNVDDQILSLQVGVYLLSTEKTAAWPVIASLILLKGIAQRTGRTDGVGGLKRITPTAAVKAVRSPVANTSLDPEAGGNIIFFVFLFFFSVIDSCFQDCGSRFPRCML